MYPVKNLLHSPYVLLTLTVLFWSGNWIVGRALTGTTAQVSPMALSFIRWVIAALILIVMAWRGLREHWPLIRVNVKRIALLAFWGTGLHNAFSYLGLAHTTATNGVMLNSATPIMIIVLGWLVFKQRITRLQALGVAISLVGVLTILTRGEASALAHFQLNNGDLIVLFSMYFWAGYTILLRLRPNGIPGLVLLACCACLGVVFLLPLALVELLWLDGRVVFNAQTVPAMLYVGIFPSVVSYVMWNRAVAQVGANVAGLFMHLMPVFGSLLAWLFLGERLHLYHFAGIVLILAGIALTSRRID